MSASENRLMEADLLRGVPPKMVAHFSQILHFHVYIRHLGFLTLIHPLLSWAHPCQWRPLTRAEQSLSLSLSKKHDGPWQHSRRGARGPAVLSLTRGSRGGLVHAHADLVGGRQQAACTRADLAANWWRPARLVQILCWVKHPVAERDQISRGLIRPTSNGPSPSPSPQ